MKRSKIAWTDFSGGNLNVVTGCTPVSAGCEHCYARRIYERFGRDHSTVKIHWDKLDALERMQFGRGLVRGPDTKPLAFLCDTGDLFHEKVPNGFLWRLYEIMAKRQDVIWQILTKRPAGMFEFYRFAKQFEGTNYALKPTLGQWPLPNVWLGVTAENQAMADERIPILLKIPAAVHFVSCEPLLGPVDVITPMGDTLRGMSISPLLRNVLRPLDWVIVGGESGSGRRPMEDEWARDIRDQCSVTDIAFFFKQHAGTLPGHDPLLDGQKCHQWPRG